jgi:hypothetical protein
MVCLAVALARRGERPKEMSEGGRKTEMGTREGSYGTVESYIHFRKKTVLLWLCLCRKVGVWVPDRFRGVFDSGR